MSQRVLLVDDDETLLATLRYNLVKEGYLVSEARTGTQAIAQARNTRPDLIVLDLMLPEVNGLEVCRILRTETRIPILMLTAKDGELDKVIGLQIGADDYLTKPFSLLELMARISALLRRATPAVCSRATRSSARCGGAIFLDGTPRSMSTFGGCARSSNAWPRFPSASPRCPVRATGWTAWGSLRSRAQDAGWWRESAPGAATGAVRPSPGLPHTRQGIGPLWHSRVVRPTITLGETRRR